MMIKTTIFYGLNLIILEYTLEDCPSKSVREINFFLNPIEAGLGGRVIIDPHSLI